MSIPESSGYDCHECSTGELYYYPETSDTLVCDVCKEEILRSEYEEEHLGGNV